MIHFLISLRAMLRRMDHMEYGVCACIRQNHLRLICWLQRSYGGVPVSTSATRRGHHSYQDDGSALPPPPPVSR